MTAIAQPVRARPAPRPERSTRSVAWWGMALLCATEGTLFACLIASYFYLAVGSRRWPPPGIEVPKLLLPGMMTACLVLSSAVLHWAERGIRQGQRGRLTAALAGSIMLGAAFLALQAREYADKLKHFRPQEHAYASLFYTITGFHGAHVAAGVLLLSYTLLRAARGHFTARDHVGVSVTALYWHFVDVVWLVIVISLYLSPRWSA